MLNRHAKILEIIQTLSLAASLSGTLHCRQQERHEDADDRDDHQQFDQCESGWQLAAGGRRRSNDSRNRHPIGFMTKRLWPVHNWHLRAIARIKTNTPVDPVSDWRPLSRPVQLASECGHGGHPVMYQVQTVGCKHYFDKKAANFKAGWAFRPDPGVSASLVRLICGVTRQHNMSIMWPMLAGWIIPPITNRRGAWVRIVTIDRLNFMCHKPPGILTMGPVKVNFGVSKNSCAIGKFRHRRRKRVIVRACRRVAVGCWGVSLTNRQSWVLR